MDGYIHTFKPLKLWTFHLFLLHRSAAPNSLPINKSLSVSSCVILMSEVQYRANVISCSGADKYEERKKRREKRKFILSFLWLLSELDLPLKVRTLLHVEQDRRQADGERERARHSKTHAAAKTSGETDEHGDIHSPSLMTLKGRSTGEVEGQGSLCSEFKSSEWERLPGGWHGVHFVDVVVACMHNCVPLCVCVCAHQTLALKVSL